MKSHATNSNSDPVPKAMIFERHALLMSARAGRQHRYLAVSGTTPGNTVWVRQCSVLCSSAVPVRVYDTVCISSL